MTTRIIAFADASYIPVARNWLLALRAIGLDEQATLVTLDDEVRRAFPAQRVMHRPIDGGNLEALWAHRIAVFRELLHAGEAFIHSDVDAVWLADPRGHIAGSDADMVFSQGTIWPPDVHDRHRLVLCCGFFSLTPSERVMGFINAVAARLDEDRDDQAAVNRVISSVIEGWLVEAPYEIAFRDTSFIASPVPIRAIPRTDGNADWPTVAVLPHHIFPRLVEKLTKEMVVAHPLSGKSCADKRAYLSRLGIWNPLAG